MPTSSEGSATGCARCSSRRPCSTSGRSGIPQDGASARQYLESRGLGEEVCREFRLGLSPAGATLARKAREKFSADELAAAGLVTRRGTDYFQRRLMFPLADARGRVIGFQARKLHEDDPLRGKYVNSPESELFHKSNVLYGFDLARGAIAKQDRAVVVEGNTDVIALRQAKLEPVVASMGTALTERQLSELSRLTPACSSASTPTRPARTQRCVEWSSRCDRGSTFASSHCPRARTPPTSRRRSRRGSQTQSRTPCTAFVSSSPGPAIASMRTCGSQDVLNDLPESPERHEAWRLANDQLGLTVQLRAAAGGTASAGGAVSARLFEVGDKLERSALAGVRAHPALGRVLAELGPEHFDSELHRQARDSSSSPSKAPESELVSLLAGLDALAEKEGIDEETAKQMLLRLRERRLRREFEGADEADLSELQHKLAEIRTAIREFA